MQKSLSPEQSWDIASKEIQYSTILTLRNSLRQYNRKEMTGKDFDSILDMLEQQIKEVKEIYRLENY